MKNNFKTFAEKTLMKAAQKVTSGNVNSVCAFAMHQPRLPEAAAKLRKQK